MSQVEKSAYVTDSTRDSLTMYATDISIQGYRNGCKVLKKAQHLIVSWPPLVDKYYNQCTLELTRVVGNEETKIRIAKHGSNANESRTSTWDDTDVFVRIL